MPWKESSVMEERLRFVARLLDGEGMSELCREFGISRKTGYKIFNRYREEGLYALTDRSRRPVRYANQLPEQIELKFRDLRGGAAGQTASILFLPDGSASGGTVELLAGGLRIEIAVDWITGRVRSRDR